ncbi:MFS transporter [Marinigracilibium pacificum]|uniref:MFS transporter n=1 Tax=Marinigracilibium pacificum TaxID=2729599 RepID=A0A848IXC7_9BACT|nr:MFS transporter [Marinigracilibium pacificum]NMM48957.1 MFS transporter [Marinigracilibium pacificum]
MQNKQLYTRQFWLLCFSSFLFFASFNILIPELPSYLSDMGGEEYLGWIIGLFTISAGLSRPFSGKLTDTIGRIPIMIYGVFVCIIAGILYSHVTTVFGLLALRLVHGMSTGFKPTATSAYVADISPDHRRGEAMGILGMFGGLGMAMGNTISSWIVMNYSINAMFYTSSGLALASILVLFGMKETLEKKQKFNFSLLKVSLIDIYEPRALPAAITMGLSVFSFGIALTLIPDLSEHLGLENKGIFFGIFMSASIVIRLIAGKLSDKYGRIPVLISGLVMLSFTMFLIGASTNLKLLYIAAVIFGFAAGINSPTIFAWTIDLAEDKYRGRALATVFIALEIGIGSGAFISGAIYDSNPKNFSYAFWTGGIVALIAVFVSIYYFRKSRKLATENYES